MQKTRPYSRPAESGLHFKILNLKDMVKVISLRRDQDLFDSKSKSSFHLCGFFFFFFFFALPKAPGENFKQCKLDYHPLLKFSSSSLSSDPALTPQCNTQGHSRVGN